MKQSVILYKVSAPGGEPLDRNDEPIANSGLRQAVALLEGTKNPNPALFEVVGYFNEGGVFRGIETFRIDQECDGAVLRVDPYRVDVSDGPVVLTVESGGDWSVPPSAFATFSPSSGGPGVTLVTVQGTGTGQVVKQFTNVNGGSAEIYLINLPGAGWILEDGTWNNNGRWTSGGIWNY